MRKSILALAVAGAAVMAAAPAGAQPARQQCLRANQIDSFSSIRGTDRAIVVTDRFRNRYRVSFNAPCDDVDFNGAVQIRSLSGSGLSCITRGDLVISRSVTGWRDRCVITRVEPYTRQMERADRARERYWR